MLESIVSGKQAGHARASVEGLYPEMTEASAQVTEGGPGVSTALGGVACQFSGEQTVYLCVLHPGQAPQHLGQIFLRIYAPTPSAWRRRKRGWLTTVNIAGRPYVTDKALSEFLRRVEAGEFAKEPKTPNRFGRVHKSSPPASGKPPRLS